MSYRQALAVREFRWLLFAGTQSGIGDQLARVAISVLVFDRTGSTALTALTYAMSFLPALVGGVLLARLADIFPRRHVVVSCDAVRAVVIALLVVPGMPIEVMWGLLAIETIASSLFSTAQASMLPDMLEGPTYSSGQALWSATTQVSQLVGFAVGGVVVAALGSASSIMLDATSFLVSAVVFTWAVKLRSAVALRPASNTGGRSRDLAVFAGALHIIRSPRLGVLAGLVWVECFYTAGEGLAVPYARSVGGGTLAAGFLLAAGPLGTAVGALVIARVVRQEDRLRWMGPLAVMTALPLLCCGFKPGLLVTLAVWTLSGTFSGYYVLAIAEFTLSTPSSIRAQAVGIASAVFATTQGLAMAVCGVVATSFGPARAVALLASVGMACALLLASQCRRLRVAFADSPCPPGYT